jgi:hypothetical protein
MGRLQALAFSPEAIGASIAAYRPRASDIVITPFGKCGTTWLQQTFHCLRTRGDMDFDDISRVTPWIEMAGACGLDLDAPQRAAPRGFKSHLPYDAIPKGARYVVALRDPKDAMISMFRFMEGWFIEPGAMPFATFARSRMTRRGPDYWHHLVSWWEQRDNPDVLLLSYEDMTAEPEANIRRLAAFSGIPLDDDLLALTLEHSSRAFMLAHKDRFDDLMMRRLTEERCNLPAGSDSAKVRARPAGPPRQEMTPEIEAEIDALWRETVTAKLGFETYAALESALRARRSE